MSQRALIPQERDEYAIYTEGSNLEGVIEIPAAMATTSVFEIDRVYGVEGGPRRAH